MVNLHIFTILFKARANSLCTLVVCTHYGEIALDTCQDINMLALLFPNNKSEMTALGGVYCSVTSCIINL